MSDVTEQALMRAYELIEEEKLTEAEALLKPILEQEPDNADAWWLYAHAVSDPETARDALNQVLKLDGSYEGAQELLVQLNDHYAGPPAAVTQQRTPVVPPSTLPSLPDDDDVDSPDFLADMEEAKEATSAFDDDFSLDDIEEAGPAAPAPGRSFPLVPVVIGLILILLVVVLLLANPFGTTPPATQQVAVPSETAITVVTPTPLTDTTEEATAAVIPSDSTVAQALSAFELVEGTVTISNTSLGRTQLAGICTSTDAMRDALADAMESLAAVSGSVGADVEAIGVTLIDCENGNNPLRVIAVPVADAAAYSAGDITAEDFRARWVAAA
jgi:tetratricopeptide (TPR) repeat protein